MREAVQIKSLAELPVTEILIEDRLRPVSEKGVAALLASIEALGVMKDPIQVRKVKHRAGALVLIAGGHRLEAAKRLGWETIPATVWDCTDDWARLMEIDDNVAGAELSVVDTAVFLAERKDVYERIHPETRQGSAGGRAKSRGANRALTFNLNRWLDQSTSPFVEIHVYDRGAAAVDLEEMDTVQVPCWIGVDLSKNEDLTVVVACWPDGDDGYQVAAWFFCPEDNLRDRGERHGVDYVTWAEEGFIIPTPGNTVDLRAVETHNHSS